MRGPFFWIVREDLGAPVSLKPPFPKGRAACAGFQVSQESVQVEAARMPSDFVAYKVGNVWVPLNSEPLDPFVKGAGCGFVAEVPVSESQGYPNVPGLLG